MKKQSIFIYSICGLFLAFSACVEKRDGSPQKEVIASVYETELTLEDARTALMGNYNIDDSTEVFMEFIREWIREQTLLHKAKEILTDYEKDKSDLIVRYYNDLLLHELHEKLLQERLDTEVVDQAIEDYYVKNKQNFELKENILRLRFVKFKNPLVESEELWNKFIQGDPDDIDGLAKLAELSGGYYFDDDTTWLTFNDILKEIPIITYNQENYLNNNKYIKLIDQSYTYFVLIKEFKVKSSASPLEFERERIKNIILNKRKVELLQLIENEIVEEAYNTQKIITF